MSMRRLLEHGAEECLSQHPLLSNSKPTPVSASPPSPRGQMLIELEFLCKHADERTICIYSKTPSYIRVMAEIFDCVQFIGFEHTGEYEPDPQNLITTSNIFCKDLARLVCCRYPQERCLLITSHEDNPMHQMVYHNVVRASRSLLCISDMPEEFVSGDLIFPLYTPYDSTVVYLDTPKNACARIYFPGHLRDELACFHLLERVIGDYDKNCAKYIIDLCERRLNKVGIALYLDNDAKNLHQNVDNGKHNHRDPCQNT